MERKIGVMLVAFFLSLVVFTMGNAEAAKYKPEYKLSLVVGPKGPWGEAAAMFADTVRDRTKGRVNIKVYYAGQLFAGKQTNEFLLLREGVADFALGSTINWSTTIRELNLFSLPFFFPSYKALDAVEAGEVGKRIFKTIEEKGVLGLGWGENGFRELTNSKRPVLKPEDMDGLKIRVVGSPIFIDTFKALGANPIIINWAEAITAFQQRTVDGQENPVVSVITPYKIWEFHKYITLWHYAIDPLIMGVNKEVWDGFTPEDRDIIRKAALEATAWQKKEARKGLEGSSEALEFLKKQGMEVTTLSPAQLAAFKEKTKSVYEKWVKEIGSDLVKAAENAVQAATKK